MTKPARISYWFIFLTIVCVGWLHLATPLLAAGTIIAAGATLALAYGGSAVQLRPGGAFGLDAGGGAATWDLSRSSTVGSLALTAVVCMVVAVYAARWISEQEPRT